MDSRRMAGFIGIKPISNVHRLGRYRGWVIVCHKNIDDRLFLVHCSGGAIDYQC
jgi:hypothetical protein